MAPLKNTRSARFRELKMMRDDIQKLFGTNVNSITPVYNEEKVLKVSQNTDNKREYIVFFSVEGNRNPIGNTNIVVRTKLGDEIAKIIQISKNSNNNNTYYAFIRLSNDSQLEILDIRSNDFRVFYSNIVNPVVETYDPTVPAPIIDTIFASNSVLQVNFSALTNNVKNYEYSLNGEDYINANVTSSPIIISGLINGTLYSVKIRAIYYDGPGKDSNIFTSTPVPVSALAPTIDTILNSNGALQLNFSAPVDDGGSPITSYQYSLNGGSYVNVIFTTYEKKNPASKSFSIFITGLINRQPYSVKIRAVTSAGYGKDSNVVTAMPLETILLP